MARRTKAEAEQTRQRIIDAARKVFYQSGVGRSTLEEIAKAAGVTRGAVYWHFENKTDLFFAMRAQVTLPLIDRVDSMLQSGWEEDPLRGIEAALNEFLTILETDEATREVFRIIKLRCEYVDEFAGVLAEINNSQNGFAEQLALAYQHARDKGVLREGLDPGAMAQDTAVFMAGLLQRWLSESESGPIASNARRMIGVHVALRRREGTVRE
ncbi:MAG: TetR family transcriptional regulator [Sulfuricella sp.]|nr:TetR family transcriptional regulator [Sulfuricella sp.]